MNERERFRRLFCGVHIDRPPLLEEGVRDEVLETWRAQGMPAGKTHRDVFGLTPHENLGPDITSLPSYFGRIMDLSARDYRRAFHASPRRFPADWRRTVRRLENRDHIVCLWASRGFFQALGAEDWPTLRQVLRSVIKDPKSIRDRIEMYGDFCARMLEMALREVAPEFIYLSEPISDNRAPLIAPSMFAEFMMPAYRKIIAAAREHGCANILVSTYGNTALLFPAMIEAGVTMLWISEAAEVPELDYRRLRREYGPSLGLIGGVPLSILRAGEPGQIRRRVEETVVPLLRSGRYIPLAGGRIRADIPWEVYKCYREVLAGIYNTRQNGSQAGHG
jgi:hypothetical protein